MLGKRKSLKANFLEESKKQLEEERKEYVKKHTYKGHFWEKSPSPYLKTLIEHEADIYFEDVGMKNIRETTIKALKKGKGKFTPSEDDKDFFIYLDYIKGDEPGTFLKYVEQKEEPYKDTRKLRAL